MSLLSCKLSEASGQLTRPSNSAAAHKHVHASVVNVSYKACASVVRLQSTYEVKSLNLS